MWLMLANEDNAALEIEEPQSKKKLAPKTTGSKTTGQQTALGLIGRRPKTSKQTGSKTTRKTAP